MRQLLRSQSLQFSNKEQSSVVSWEKISLSEITPETLLLIEFGSSYDILYLKFLKMKFTEYPNENYSLSSNIASISVYWRIP